MGEKLLCVKEAAARLTLSKSSLDKWRTTGGGPRYLRFGRSIRYREADLAAWIGARQRSSTSDLRT